MRLNVLLSAAMLLIPGLIILYDAVSGLDVGTALVLRAVVRALAADGRIIFYSSHELETVEKLSTRVIILRGGRIVADDSASRLRALMALPSLEDVFSQLAVHEDVEGIATQLVDVARL
jgi:ABC-2 type transport system ATP-binding protein